MTLLPKQKAAVTKAILASEKRQRALTKEIKRLIKAFEAEGTHFIKDVENLRLRGRNRKMVVTNLGLDDDDPTAGYEVTIDGEPLEVFLQDTDLADEITTNVQNIYATVETLVGFV